MSHLRCQQKSRHMNIKADIILIVIGVSLSEPDTE